MAGEPAIQIHQKTSQNPGNFLSVSESPEISFEMGAKPYWLQTMWHSNTAFHEASHLAPLRKRISKALTNLRGSDDQKVQKPQCFWSCAEMGFPMFSLFAPWTMSQYRLDSPLRQCHLQHFPRTAHSTPSLYRMMGSPLQALEVNSPLSSRWVSPFGIAKQKLLFAILLLALAAAGIFGAQRERLISQEYAKSKPAYEARSLILSLFFASWNIIQKTRCCSMKITFQPIKQVQTRQTQWANRNHWINSWKNIAIKAFQTSFLSLERVPYTSAASARHFSHLGDCDSDQNARILGRKASILSWFRKASLCAAELWGEITNLWLSSSL